MASWSSPVFNRTSATHTSYGTSDLNRVEENSQYLSDKLNTLGYPCAVSTDYTWLRSEFFKYSHMMQYLLNVETVRSILTLPVATPSTPTTLEDITLSIANDIEKIQNYIYDTIEDIELETDLKRAGTLSAVAGSEIGLI